MSRKRPSSEPASVGEPRDAGSIIVGLNAVILAVTDEEPKVLTVPAPLDLPSVWAGLAAPPAALPSGPLDPAGDPTLQLGLRRWVREQTGLELGYVEQLYTFGTRDREPAERLGQARVLSVAYLALAREERQSTVGGARWLPWHRFLPWEDFRAGRPELLDGKIAFALDRWVGEAPTPSQREARRERADITFGLGGASWDGERVLERYELLYEAGLAIEAQWDHRLRRLRGEASEALAAPPVLALPEAELPGWPMAFDHRRILATALGRMRGKIRYRPVVFELLPESFTLLQLQRVVEALAGVPLHKGNFRRLLEHGGLVEGTGRLESKTGGRPAELFRFRREVLRERPAPGVGLPGLPGMR
jgi:hypothetical protein